MNNNLIWRLNLKTNGLETHSQSELFDFCKSNNIIGVGWSNEDYTKELDSSVIDAKEIKNYIFNYHIKKNWKTRSFSSATNSIVNRINIGDFIWTRSEGVYWLAKVVSKAKYNREDSLFKDFDIGFYREVEFSEKSLSQSEVPGKIISSFCARSSVQNVSDYGNKLYDYSKNLFDNSQNYKIRLEDWIYFFSAEDIEEIIGLYLQVEKKLLIYTSTNKKSTAKIEFEMVDRYGNLSGVQVKTGNVGINGNNYKDISRKMKIFLFATSNNVQLKDNDKLIHITKEEVTEFIKNNILILPERIKKWII